MSGTTALVSEGNFSFTNGVFFAESSGHNKHRRATHEELRTHFASGSDKDHTAHWFEAQLMHYGLPPSKTKSVARMRLFDAVQGGSLSVPFHITELEQKLKKEWTKRDRDEKKAAKAASTKAEKAASTKAEKAASTKAEKAASTKAEKAASTKAAKAASTKAAKAAGTKAAPKSEAATAKKRKAAVTVNVTVNTSASAVATSAPKRTKTLASSAGDSAPAPRFPTKQTARRGPGWRAPSRPEPARRDSSPPASSPAPRTKQMARRGRPFAPRGRIESSQTQTSGYSDFATSFDEAPPPPYEEYSDSSNRFDGNSLPPLGLLNGRYDISSPYVESEWPMYGSDFSLVLTIVGSSLWGRFDLGVVEGVLYIEERPRASSSDNVPFVWRGREAEGQIFYDEWSNRGSLRFLGDGSIQGYFEYQDIQFEGQRLPGQGTRSELDARTLHNEWDSYNEDEYDRESGARW